MFYGEISHQERLRQPIRPNRRLDFEIERNDFNEWLRVWKMMVPEGRHLEVFPKNKKQLHRCYKG